MLSHVFSFFRPLLRGVAKNRCIDLPESYVLACESLCYIQTSIVSKKTRICQCLSGSFLKCWYPTTIGFPTKNDHFGVEIGGATI